MTLPSLDRPPAAIAPKSDAPWFLPSRRRVNRFVRQHRISLSVCAGLVLIGCLPYTLRPGGKVELLPLAQQNIQVKVSGRVSRVMVDGGSRDVIQSGRVIATLDVPDLENQLQTTRKQIATQNAGIQVAQRQIKVSEEEVSVTLAELDTARVRARFSRKAYERYRDLYREGAVSMQQVEDYQKQAETDASNLLELQATVQQKQQQRQQSEEKIKVAQGEFQRLNEELKFATDELNRARVTMPFDGVIVDHRLKDKVGTYLEKGSTFATAEEANTDVLRARVQVSEVVADRLKAGRPVEVKLMAFPDDPIRGTVVAVEPSIHLLETEQNRSQDTGNMITVAQLNAGRLLGVIIKLPNQNGKLRPGMSGYAKIQGDTVPVAVAFSRALARFFNIEVWSWLP
ncbi:HlyD family secretion protein [Synechococcus sp. CBW1004]|uniref:HlyD family secretion protein n=1 Tax=Synechococcus sp. CBW1004 TaxID=1353136 RepID=UPI0018CE13F6|nr:efflux RND transporter periplasmic adaptor subunit [Synechococcus sp. CBW1004]QPN62151.1 efflux RND transporter periplasmic adaptor subunit [Synechococcus sp. CBW1004]